MLSLAKACLQNCNPEKRETWLIHHDLHAIAGFHLGIGFEAIHYAKTLERAIDAAHAMRQGLNCVAGLHVDDLEA